MKILNAVALIGLSALVIGPVPATLFSIAAFDSAMAESGKSNGGGNGSNGEHGKSASGSGNSASTHSTTGDTSYRSAKAVEGVRAASKGKLASELKGLNAVKANFHALDHAAPNSQVGRIAAYRDAAVATIAVQATLTKAEATLDKLPVPPRGLVAIDAKIAALDPNAADYQDVLASLQAERVAAVTYAEAVAAVHQAATQLALDHEAEDAALLTAADGRTLSDEAIAYIRSVLKL